MGRIKFYKDATKAGLPFICIDGGEAHNVVMLIDTGSTDNILFGYAYQQVKHQLKEVEGDYRVTGVDGKPMKVTKVMGHMPFCGNNYEMSFLVRDEDDAGRALSVEYGLTIIGMIGTHFMAEHDWVIDFRKQEVIIPDTDVTLEKLRKSTIA